MARWLNRFRSARLFNNRKRRDNYGERLTKELNKYRSVEEVHDLPPIFHYWSNTYIRPMVEEHGFGLTEELFAKYFSLAASRTGSAPVFLSLGAGNCDTEIRTAQLLRDWGLTDFAIECLELNPEMIERGKGLAARSGVEARVGFVEGDLNRWKSEKQYAANAANQ
jgi:hypothetical protein